MREAKLCLQCGKDYKRYLNFKGKPICKKCWDARFPEEYDRDN